MIVRMTADQWGCPDGRNEYLYEAGRDYDIPPHLATVFVEQIGCAHPVDEQIKSVTPVDEPKAMEPEENKMLAPAENKARRGRPRKGR